MKRCVWVNLKNPKYIEYHDNEWGKPSYDDSYLFEMLVLESFQSRLSWEIVLNKREEFKKAFDNFNYKLIALYDNFKVVELLQNKNIIRNKLKIHATINNAKVFMKIQSEFGSFSAYIWSFTQNQIVLNLDDDLKTTSPLSDKVAKDLKIRGMKFLGSTTIYSYLQAIGIINDHELHCDFRF